MNEQKKKMDRWVLGKKMDEWMDKGVAGWK